MTQGKVFIRSIHRSDILPLGDVSSYLVILIIYVEKSGFQNKNALY